MKSMDEKHRKESLDFVEQVFTASEGATEGKTVRNLVEEIRSKKYYLPELELIMVDENDSVIGYAMFSRFHLEGNYEEQLLLLSPVAVRTDLQRQHIEGNPANYNPRGFETSCRHGITASSKIGLPAPECLMVKELRPGALNHITGVVDYSCYQSLI